MYTLVLIILIGGGIGLIIHGIRHRKNVPLVAGIIVAGGASIFFGLLDFWDEMLWFEAMGYGRRFWEAFWVKAAAGGAGIGFGSAMVYLLTAGIAKKLTIRIVAAVLGGVIGGFQGWLNWEIILKFLHQAPTQLQDPIFGKTVGFYLFRLPFYDAGYHLLLVLAFISLSTAVIAGFISLRPGGSLEMTAAPERNSLDAVFRCSGVLIFVSALGKYLDRYHLMYSELGAVTGPGWTDVHVRIPALVVMIVVMGIGGILLSVRPLRRILQRRMIRFQGESAPRGLYTLGAVALVIAVVWIFGLVIVPAGFQYLRVEPNEITFEKPYIAHNIAFTRHGFKLNEVEEREFPAAEQFGPQMVTKNRQIFDNIRLWDWRALDAVYKQFQEIRLYYEFDDVDVDRYTAADQYLQVMVSAREMEIANLPEQSQTFVNRRFKYTHGYGITLTSVSDFTPQGLPDLIVKGHPADQSF